MKVSHGVIVGAVGMLIVLAIVNRVSALAPVSTALKTITG